VASHWRIRHKLMLGLGLVVGTMVLLLGGTLRGLWSYYVTMNSIRSKTAELHAAEDLKEAVGEVVRWAEWPRIDPEARDGERDPAPDPDADPGKHPEADADPVLPRRRPTDLREAIRFALDDLEIYERQLEDTVSHGRDPGNGQHPKALIDSLRRKFAQLRQEEDQQEKLVAIDVNAADREKEIRDRQRRHKLIDQIQRDTHDLCNVIYDDLHLRINESRSHYQVTLWIALPASIVGLLLLCGLLRSFYAWVFHPIRDLEQGVVRVGQGDFDQRIRVDSGDEMEDLGAAFNKMMDHLQSLYSDLARQVNERSRQLVRSERLASVGFLAAGVAHEINNPLASIAFCSEALEARLGAVLRQLEASGHMSDEQETFSKYLKMIQEEAFRCKTITEKLLAFSRSSERRREKTDLRALVQSVLDVTQHLQNHRGKTIAFEALPDRLGSTAIVAAVCAEEIKSVVLNLVVNALDSMDEGGKLTIRLSQQGDMAQLQLTDTGCGMTQEVLENIFEPFFTRSRTGKGTGLGLTITHRIVTQHGGEIEALSPGPNQGSTFTVRLPLQAEEAIGGDAGRPDAPPPSEARQGTLGRAA
jgi:signal transduction histidine kinase